MLAVTGVFSVTLKGLQLLGSRAASVLATLAAEIFFGVAASEAPAGAVVVPVG